MSFVLPIAFLLLLPLALAGVLASASTAGFVGRLPGAWERLVSNPLKGHVAQRSGLGRARAPVLCLTIGGLLIVALARPGIDADRIEDHASLAGRVIVLDVDGDLAGHQLFIDGLFSNDPMSSTAVVAVSGNAYRIVPFTTDRTQIDRYVRVLDADMMPVPGHRPHLGMARAERMLNDAGFLVRQIVLVSDRGPPERFVDVPRTDTLREIVALGASEPWQAWAEGWGANLNGREDADRIARDLETAARSAATAELPASRVDLSTILLGLAAVLWLLLFRRRAA